MQPIALHVVSPGTDTCFQRPHFPLDLHLGALRSEQILLPSAGPVQVSEPSLMQAGLQLPSLRVGHFSAYDQCLVTTMVMTLTLLCLLNSYLLATSNIKFIYLKEQK